MHGSRARKGAQDARMLLRHPAGDRPSRVVGRGGYPRPVLPAPWSGPNGDPMPQPMQPLDAPLPDAAALAPDEHLRGLIVVDKPQGLTSRRALNVVEKRLGLGALGHCGSLDPLATGVLVLVVGKARKVQDLIVRGEKVYDMTV